VILLGGAAFFVCGRCRIVGRDSAFLTAVTLGFFLTTLTAEVLGVAGGVGAVDVAGAFGAAVAAGADDGGIDVVDGDADTLIEDVAFAIVVFTTNCLVFSVFDDTSEQLVDVIKSFPDEKATELFAADSTGAVGEDFFPFQFASVFVDPGRQFLEVADVGSDRIFKMAEVELVIITSIEDDGIRFIHRGFPFGRGEMVARGLVR